MYTGQIAARPDEIGCLQTFRLSYKESTIRTSSDNSAFIKVRRRTTKPVEAADCSITLKAADVQKFVDWYESACACGSIPTKIKVPPNSVEQIWRFSSPPQIDWIDNAAASISWSMERLPLWR